MTDTLETKEVTDAKDRVLFMYLRDPRDRDHVATIARYKSGNLITFAWAVNKITYHASYHKEGNTRTSVHTRRVHDVFSKAQGRKIAEARLHMDRSSVTVELQEGDRPVQAILETLASYEQINNLKIPAFLSRVAEEQLATFQFETFLRTLSEPEAAVTETV